MCAPSIPPPVDPVSKLSRVTGQEACLTTETSFIPYLANKPFSLAIIKGAESVRAMNPNLAVVTSGASPAAILVAGVVLAVGLASPSTLLLQALVKILAAAVAPAVSINFRREN